MFDILPFPRITGNTPEEKVAELINYLIQFKETLEFALMNISAENLSPDLINRLNALGADIEKSHTEREEELSQISRISVAVNVNYETGHLEYAISK